MVNCPTVHSDDKPVSSGNQCTYIDTMTSIKHYVGGIIFLADDFTNDTVLFHSVPQDGWTALMLASDSGHTDVVQLLLSSGAQVDLQDEVRHSINLLIIHKTDGRT